MSAIPPTCCPICEQQVSGDENHFQRHVNQHLDDTEERESRRVAEQLAQENQNHHASLDESMDAALVASVDQFLTVEEKLARQSEANDAAIAFALHERYTNRRYSPGRHKVAVGRSLADSADQVYQDILQRILPIYDPIELLTRRKVHICSRLDLYSSNKVGLGWDCGYRNIQMLCSALFYDPNAASALREAGILEVPSIPEIAGRIEKAWEKGFDPDGAASFGRSLTGREVWIGATEAYVFFRSINVNAFITDFETPTEKEKGDMFEWILKHFDQYCNGRSCSIHEKGMLSPGKAAIVAPIFCQWQGHSLTIIGAEKTRSGDVLLVVLDPSRGFFNTLRETYSLPASLVRREVDHAQFGQPRFQFVSITATSSRNQRTEVASTIGRDTRQNIARLNTSTSNAAGTEVSRSTVSTTEAELPNGDERQSLPRTSEPTRRGKKGLLRRFRFGGPS